MCLRCSKCIELCRRHLCVCEYIFTYIDVCMHIYVYKYTYTYIYIYVPSSGADATACCSTPAHPSCMHLAAAGGHTHIARLLRASQVCRSVVALLLQCVAVGSHTHIVYCIDAQSRLKYSPQTYAYAQKRPLIHSRETYNCKRDICARTKETYHYKRDLRGHV